MVLFADRSIVRGEVEVAAIMPCHASYAWTGNQGDEVIWGRRSVFSQRRKKLLVSEFFLPDIQQSKS